MTFTKAAILFTAVLLLAIPAVSSQPAPTPTPVPVSGHYRLPPGLHEFSCFDGQPVTIIPPNRAICPPDAPIVPTATPTLPPPTPIPGGFVERFDGAPAAPQPWRPSTWEVTVHSRDRETWVLLDSMAVQHGPGCEPPPGSHVNNTYEGAVFQCRDHIMSAIRASGYGVIYLTPNQLVDFSEEEAVIRFDVSTLRTSNRDWFDVWITPYEDNLQTPLEDWLPDLNGEPRRAIHIRMKFGSPGNLAGVFEGFVIDDFTAVALPQRRTTGYETFFPPSATLRQTFELRISSTHIKFGMPVFDLWWIDTDMAALEWDSGVVQIGTHSYNPMKDCPLTCSPGTWHWDNFSISPATPFTIIRADRRFVSPVAPDPLTFPSPAPAGSHLRFSGIGNSLEISTDGGATWQPAQLQAQESMTSDHFRSYWTTIPAGITSVRIRGQNWWGGGLACARYIYLVTGNSMSARLSNQLLLNPSHEAGLVPVINYPIVLTEVVMGAKGLDVIYIARSALGYRDDVIRVQIGSFTTWVKAMIIVLGAKGFPLGNRVATAASFDASAAAVSLGICLVGVGAYPSAVVFTALVGICLFPEAGLVWIGLAVAAGILAHFVRVGFLPSRRSFTNPFWIVFFPAVGPFANLVGVFSIPTTSLFWIFLVPSAVSFTNPFKVVLMVLALIFSRANCTPAIFAPFITPTFYARPPIFCGHKKTPLPSSKRSVGVESLCGQYLNPIGRRVLGLFQQSPGLTC